MITGRTTMPGLLLLLALLLSASAQTEKVVATPSPAPTIQQAEKKQEDSAWKKAGEIVDVVLKVIGTIAAATWTIFMLLKERKLKPRLEPKIMGKVILGDQTKYALVNIQVKNPGSSKVDIDQNGTALVVYPLRSIPSSDSRAMWSESAVAYPILEKHHWIEPGETVEESVLAPLRQETAEPIKLRLRINSKKVTWETVVIIENAILQSDTSAIKKAMKRGHE